MISTHVLRDQEPLKKLGKECLTEVNSLDHNFLNLDLVLNILEGK